MHELLKQPGLDAVCITTPSALHLEPALAAIRAGKHLMIEKPLDATVEGTDHILREAEKAGVRVGSIFQARFGDAARQVKAADRRRALRPHGAGELLREVESHRRVLHGLEGQAFRGWRRRHHQPGHPRRGPAAVVRRHAGRKCLPGRTRRVHAIESEDTCVAALKFASGAFGTIEASTARGRAGRGASKSAARTVRRVMEDDDITRWDFRVAQPEDEKIRATRESAAMGSGAAAPMAIKFEGHLRQIQDFIDGIREQRPFFIEGREARKAVALVRAIYDSAASGKPVKLKMGSDAPGLSKNG